MTTMELSPVQEDTLRGYLGRLLDEKTKLDGQPIPDRDSLILETIYVGLDYEAPIPLSDTHSLLRIQELLSEGRVRKAADELNEFIVQRGYDESEGYCPKHGVEKAKQVCAECEGEATMCEHNSIIIHNEDGETTCLQCGEENA